MKVPEKFYLVPVEGRRVKDPETRQVLTAGELKPKTNYWQRRLRDGDVEERPAPADHEPKPRAKPRPSDASKE